MKKLLLSLLFSSSMLYCSAAFAKQTNDDDDGPSIQVAPVPVVHETPTYPNQIFVDTFIIFQKDHYSQILLKHKEIFSQPFLKGLTSASPEDIAPGKTYYTISFPDELDPEAAYKAYKDLKNYYIDALVSFKETEGSDNKLEADLKIPELNKTYKVRLTRSSNQ